MTDLWAADLLYPDQQDPIGQEHGGNWRGQNDRRCVTADPLLYVVWLDAGRGPDHCVPELTPRTALHLVACRSAAAA